ncbi:MAG: DUF4234 domain-containing protein [Bacilli bacterium]|jgi:drug/metabolite transporter (DMT)-like permease|nr:DUF4234 domain-containing protein [Bacilli bacterium]
MLTRRSIAMVIILSIITCGIYGIYWIIVTQNEIKRIYIKQPLSDGVVVFLLGIVTCGIYNIYWMYKTCVITDEIYEVNGLRASNNTILFVLLGVFLTPIAYYALMQDKINYLIDSTNNNTYNF